MQDIILKPSRKSIKTILAIPGDKSISHRAIILSSLANGTSIIKGFLNAKDTLNTLKIFKQLGVKIKQYNNDILAIEGVGLYGLKQSKKILNVGNSGTAIRLITGILSGQNFDSTITGDNSIKQRPMARIIEPLSEMGAKIKTNNNKAPLKIIGKQIIKAIDYKMTIASAQVKSAILLAGLYANKPVIIRELEATRNYTETMLEKFGIIIKKQDNIIKLIPNDLIACNLDIPADLSSATFFIVAGLLLSNSEIKLENIGVNPQRLGVIKILQMMGGNIQLINKKLIDGNHCADIIVKSSKLTGIEIPKNLIASAIDEIPIIMIASIFAKNSTTLHNAIELRYKESDRINAIANGFAKLGVNFKEYQDGIKIFNFTNKSGEVEIDSFADHRIAMSFIIASLALKSTIKVKNIANIKTSFPSFLELLTKIGINFKVENNQL